MINSLEKTNWINLYIYWELNLIKELGYDLNFLNQDNKKNNCDDFIEINNSKFKIPQMYIDFNENKNNSLKIKEALIFNKNLLIENFISPNNLKFPLFRNLLENYY